MRYALAIFTAMVALADVAQGQANRIEPLVPMPEWSAPPPPPGFSLDLKTDRTPSFTDKLPTVPGGKKESDVPFLGLSVTRPIEPAAPPK